MHCGESHSPHDSRHNTLLQCVAATVDMNGVMHRGESRARVIPRTTLATMHCLSPCIVARVVRGMSHVTHVYTLWRVHTLWRIVRGISHVTHVYKSWRVVRGMSHVTRVHTLWRVVRGMSHVTHVYTSWSVVRGALAILNASCHAYE